MATRAKYKSVAHFGSAYMIYTSIVTYTLKKPLFESLVSRVTANITMLETKAIQFSQ